MADLASMHLLVTGGTGFLGSRLIWGLTQAGARLSLLHRGAHHPTRAHLATLGGLFGGEAPPDAPLPTWVTGDLWLPLAGVSPAWIERHRGQIDAIVHLAADTRVQPVRRHDQTRTNVAGTEAVADLAEALDATRFHHISSASISGSSQGEFSEDDFEVGQSFRTHQEWTKYEAEHILRRRAVDGRLRLTVHRPAIIVGDSVTGGAATFPHFYQLLAAWHQCTEQHRDSPPIHLPLSPAATIPIITVDHVAMGIIAAITDSETVAQTLHWTPHTSLALGELNSALGDILGAAPIVLDPEAPWPILDATDPAHTLWQWLRAHRSQLAGGIEYLRADADALCERQGLATPAVDRALLARLHHHWAWVTGRR